MKRREKKRGKKKSTEIGPRTKKKKNELYIIALTIF
jgi:hypothetical protein